MPIVEPLMTAEDFALLDGDDRPRELVRGRVVTSSVRFPQHGQVCANVIRTVASHARDFGHLVCNGSAVITERNPDTVRGPDISFYSFERVPLGPIPDGYLSVLPEVAFEVRSPEDNWKKLLEKLVEYLNAGVNVVCVLDQMTETMRVYTSDEPETVLGPDDEFSLPDFFGDLRVHVKRFFE